MAGPITWRTIESNPIGEISRAMTSGQVGINLGFDSFQKVLDRQQAIEAANWQQEKTNNTNAFMNELAAVKTPEEYAAVQGRLQEVLSSKGAQIDQQAGRQALGAQLGQLQGRIESNQKFDAGQRNITEAPIKDLHASLIAQGKFPEAAALLEQHSLASEGPMYKSASDAQQAAATLKRANEANARSDALTAITHPEALRTAQGEAESGAVLRLASAAQQAHTQQADVRTKEVAALVKELQLPLDDTGSLSKDSVAKLHTAMKAKGIENPETYLKGDTAAADKFYDGLVASGKYSPEILAKNKAAIRAGFDPSIASGAVGVEAADKALKAARDKVAYDEKDATNWYAPGSPDANKGYEQLSGEAPKLMNLTGYDSEEDVADIQAFIHEMGTKGIETEPGSGKFVTPSINDMRHAIRTAEGGWFKDSTRASNARDIIQNMMKKPDVLKKIQEGEESSKYRTRQKILAEIGSKK